MYKIEVKDLGENKVSICAIIPHIGYKELFNLVKPYIKETNLSFCLPNNCPDGNWSYIYAGKNIIGEIKMTFINE